MVWLGCEKYKAFLKRRNFFLKAEAVYSNVSRFGLLSYICRP